MTMPPSRRPIPALVWERRAWRAGKLVVAGVDEVGRGAWAGPLVAAAVVVPAEPSARAQLTRALNRAGAVVRDSKQLNAAQRSRVVEVVQGLGIPMAISEVSVEIIDQVGVGRANKLALREAASTVRPGVDHVLVDAFEVPGLNCTHDAIVHGDSVSLSIALASIIAKTHRDQIMTEMAEEWPVYQFQLHKGYGTAAHRLALATYGPTPHHRTSFAPVAESLADVVAN
ncbi:MAG TPA: ribonuclease HII [Thermomicrobiales bacterium]|nr:ribonuclease HII [Thermomicrobiales bacterium]HRA30743.1 ribonuclease HII [Thermomicrobiales bacterium]